MPRLFGSRALPLGAAAAILATVASASGALVAAGGTPAAAASRGTPHVIFGPVSRYALSNLGGYIAEGTKGEFTSASAQWTIAKVTCTSDNNLYAPWVGIDGDGDETVEQTGVATSCSTGKPAYSAWYEMYPAGPVYFTNPVALGDHFIDSVTYANGEFTLKIDDKTAGWTKTIHKKLSASRLSAEAVIEAPGGYPKFTSVSFTDVKFNGKELSTFNPVKSDTGTTAHEYVPSAITNGDDFKMVPKS